MRSKRLIQSFFLLLLLTTPSPAQLEYTRLRPSALYWDKDDRHTAVHIVPLPRNRKLAAVGDTLYMLSAHNRVIWTWTTGGPPLTDTPIIDSKGIIYAIAFDLTWVALDSSTGEEKWRGTACGGAVYTQIKLYKRDMYIVVTDMGGYREKLHDNTIEDDLTLCRGNSILWQTRIPAEGRIEVEGGRVYWRVRRKGQTLRREIRLPRNYSNPIGKVSSLADYE